MLSRADFVDIAKRLANTLFGRENKMISRNRALIDEYAENNRALFHCKYLFIGDSHTYGLNKLSGKIPGLVNIGINGDTTTGALLRSERNVSNIDAEIAAIQIGYNDFKYRSVASTLKNYKQIISVLNAKKIFVISLFPVDSRRSIMNNKIIKFNKSLKNMCDESGGALTYINMHQKFYLPGINGISNKLTNDGVHLNRNGYMIYGLTLKQIVFDK